ncbi:MAG: HAD-IC family P-type ATPase [Desulfobacterales bacterium]|nr:HAD-IC family P-type ATPase [Desulfobacterales bacterium]
MISYIAGESTNAYVILAIVVLVAIIGFVQEYKAERAMEALREMVAPEADVMRDGKHEHHSCRGAGGRRPDLPGGRRQGPCRWQNTGEDSFRGHRGLIDRRVPAGKKGLDLLPEEAALADRKNMVFMGTIVSYGNCRAVVTATGLATELGKISGMIRHSSAPPPLKIKLEQLAKRQAILVFAISIIVFILDASRGSPIMDSLVTAIALAVAGVPEALPFIVTLALAFGTQAMARKNAIIRRLPAVETLGSTTVICTDKTGTLTTGEMTLREIHTFRTVDVEGSGYTPEGSFLDKGKIIDPQAEDLARSPSDWNAVQQCRYRAVQRRLAHSGRSH